MPILQKITDIIYYTDNACETSILQDARIYYSIDNIENSFACVVGPNGIVATYSNSTTHVNSQTAPVTFTLEPNYPNPFNASTTISYTLTTDSPVTIKVYSATGQLVRTLCDSYMPAGIYNMVVDGSDLGSGMYFYRFQSPGLTKTGKMLLVK